LQGLVVHDLEVFHLLLGGNQLRRECLRRLLVLVGLGGIALRPLLVGEDESLARGGLQAFDVTHLPGQLHLELTLVANDGGRLLGERGVLALSFFDGLLDLHLRIRVLVHLRREQRHQVLPSLGKGIRHGELFLSPSCTLRHPRAQSR